MEIKTDLFEVQGLVATNPEGDSKMDVVEVVPSVCPVPGKLVWMKCLTLHFLKHGVGLHKRTYVWWCRR